MKIRNVVAVTLSVALSLSLHGQTPKEAAAAEQQIKSITAQMYEAEKRKDLKFIFSHMSSDFTEVAGDGKIYRQADIEKAFQGVELKDYKLSDCIFNLMTSDSAYMSCVMDVNATFNGQAFPSQFRVSWVWTQVKGKWLVRFEQGTVIPPPAKSTQGKQD